MKRMKLLRSLASIADRVYLALDKRIVRRTRNLEWIPDIRHRRMGRNSYAEWAHVVGLFQSLIQLHLPRSEEPKILDIGCGTGVLAIAAAPCLGDRGHYTGIDVMEDNIAFCRRHFASSPQHDFQLLDVGNPTYNRQRADPRPWDIEAKSIDLLTALSVWTHLNEEDAVFYFREVDRVLKPAGVALVTFFVLDGDYQQSLADRSPNMGRFHRTPRDRWIFDAASSPSGHWRHPRWADHPEDAIAVTPNGLRQMLHGTHLHLERHLPGNWKERPGLYFQDVLIFRKQ